MGLTRLFIISLLFSAPVSARQDWELKTGVVNSCIRDGVRHYISSKPLPTDSQCRQINYHYREYKQQPLSTGTFLGYRCTSDCSGHLAGYNWASRRGASGYASCTGNSQSFIEGCRAYVDQMNSRTAR